MAAKKDVPDFCAPIIKVFGITFCFTFNSQFHAVSLIVIPTQDS